KIAFLLSSHLLQFPARCQDVELPDEKSEGEIVKKEKEYTQNKEHPHISGHGHFHAEQKIGESCTETEACNPLESGCQIQGHPCKDGVEKVEPWRDKHKGELQGLSNTCKK